MIQLYNVLTEEISLMTMAVTIPIDYSPLDVVLALLPSLSPPPWVDSFS